MNFNNLPRRKLFFAPLRKPLFHHHSLFIDFWRRKKNLCCMESIQWYTQCTISAHIHSFSYGACVIWILISLGMRGFYNFISESENPIYYFFSSFPCFNEMWFEKSFFFLFYSLIRMYSIRKKRTMDSYKAKAIYFPKRIGSDMWIEHIKSDMVILWLEYFCFISWLCLDISFFFFAQRNQSWKSEQSNDFDFTVPISFSD